MTPVKRSIRVIAAALGGPVPASGFVVAMHTFMVYIHVRLHTHVNLKKNNRRGSNEKTGMRMCTHVDVLRPTRRNKTLD